MAQSLQGISVENIVISPPPADGQPALKLAGKRYTHLSATSRGLTLILTHASGCHKEQWEPALEKIFELQSNKDVSQKIREAWTFDWQDHGDSAVLNETALKGSTSGIPISEWARGLVYFINSDYVRGHRLAVIGHSAGSSALLYSTKLFPTGQIPYISMVLVEPPIIDRVVFQENIKDRQRQLGFLYKITATRRDEWASKEEAFNWFGRRLPWNTWDKRVVQLFADHGLRTVSSGKVVTKCDKVHEAAIFMDTENTFVATEQIEKVCADVPIHIIFGEICDLTPRYAQDSIVDETKGRKVASVVRVPKVGHMAIQQNPEALASCIADKLSAIESHASASRL